MPYVSIACVISYVIGHALGPSMYPRADSMVSLSLFYTTSLETSGLSSLERLQAGLDSALNGFCATFLQLRGLDRA